MQGRSDLLLVTVGMTLIMALSVVLVSGCGRFGFDNAGQGDGSPRDRSTVPLTDIDAPLVPDDQGPGVHDGPEDDGSNAPDGPETVADASGPDAARDTLLVDDMPRDLVIPPSETGPPSGATYLLEQFNGPGNAFTAQRGTWTLAAGSYRQSDKTVFGSSATATIPDTSFWAETRLLVSSVAYEANPFLVGPQGGGLVIWVGSTPSSKPPTGYLCLLDPATGRIHIADFKNGGALHYLVWAAAPVKLGEAYRLRMRVENNTLACSLPALGVQTDITDTSGHTPTGTIALTTVFADVLFDYVAVGPLTP